MIEKLKKIYLKNKEIINYLIFGVLTTIINLVTYYICAKLFNIEEVMSNIISWVVAVIFAYITNKKYVFASETVGVKALLKQIGAFLGSRLFTGIIDVALFTLLFKVFKINDLIVKCITQVFVIISNYILSKLIVFKNKK